MLLVSTTVDIHIYIVKYDESMNNLEIFNPDLSVSTQGLAVDNFTVNSKQMISISVVKVMELIFGVRLFQQV